MTNVKLGKEKTNTDEPHQQKSTADVSLPTCIWLLYIVCKLPITLR